MPSMVLPLLLAASVASAAGPSQEVTVFAAASLREALTEVGAAYEQHADVAVVFNFAGSNTLAQQIVASGAGDVFVSADQEWMDEVEKAGRLLPGTRRPVVANRFVVIARHDAKSAIAKPEDLATASFRALAMGDPGAVPAGRYAKAALKGPVWDAVATRVVPAPDVRAALALVESDPEIVGIVYRTDAKASTKVRVLAELPGEATYPAAALREGHGRRFVAFLSSPEARMIFEKHGFLPR
jgi:molybdate transport system substrate-binding protein